MKNLLPILTQTIRKLLPQAPDAQVDTVVLPTPEEHEARTQKWIASLKREDPNGVKRELKVGDSVLLEDVTDSDREQFVFVETTLPGSPRVLLCADLNTTQFWNRANQLGFGGVLRSENAPNPRG